MRSLRTLMLSVFSIMLVYASAPAYAGDKEVWLGSKQGLIDLNGMQTPNIALGIPEDVARLHIARLLTIETETLLLSTDDSNIALDMQTVSADSAFRVTIPKSKTGLPHNIDVVGDVTFSVTLTFSGTGVNFLPDVHTIRIHSVTWGGSTIDLPPGTEVKIPEWLQEAVITYLSNRGLLQLPTTLATDFDLSADALYGGKDLGAISLSSDAITGELWINAAATLINQDGVVGIAEANYDLTLPKCTVFDQKPITVTGDFTKFASTDPISSIGVDESAIMFRGHTDHWRLSYTAYWRHNGVTISEHPVAVVTQGPDQGDLEVAVSSLPDVHGLYSLMITADMPVNEGERVQCQVVNRPIIKKRRLNVNVPDPITHEMAVAAFNEYESEFNLKRRQGGLPYYTTLYASIAKATIAQTVSTTMNGIGLTGTIDASKFPKVGPIDAKIRVPSTDSINCTPTRDCTPTRQCDLRRCPYTPDTRNCRRKKWWGSYNDPICEIKKGLENARRKAKWLECKARAALAKLDCERLKAQEKAACELEKATEKAGCEAIKETLEKISKIIAPDGNVAGVSGTFGFGGNAHFSLLNMHMDDALSQFELMVQFDAKVQVDGSIEFTPYNIGGHVLGCMSKWKESVVIDARVHPISYPVNGYFDIDNATNTLWMQLQLPGVTPAITPPFIALFAQNPHLVALCPILFTAGVGEGIYDLLDPNYKSTIWAGQYQIEETTVDYGLTMPGIVIPPQFGIPQPSLTITDDVRALTWK